MEMYKGRDARVSLAKQKAYWQQQLSGKLPVLEAQLDYPRPPVQSFIRAKEAVELDERLCLKLKKICAHEKVALFIPLLAAFKVILLRYTGQEDVIVGSLSADSIQDKEGVSWGAFVNLVTLRTDLTGDPSARELLRRITKTVKEAAENRDYPFEELVEDVYGDGNLNRAPIFQVMFTLCNVPFCISETLISERELANIEEHSIRCDLVVVVSEEEGILRIKFEYDVELFDVATITHLSKRFQVLLESLVHNPDTALSDLQIDERMALPSILPSMKVENRAPLSYHQERLWFIDQFETGNVYESSPTYHNIPLILHLSGPVDCNILEQSLNEIIFRHEALRTRIVTDSYRAVQVVSPCETLKLKVVDIKDDSGEASVERVVKLALEDARRPFLLQRDLLVRAGLFKMKDAESLMVVTVHHIVADKWSLQLIAQEIAEICSALTAGRASQLAKPAFHYADYTQWQRSLPEEVLAPLLFYWKHQLRGKLQVLKLPSTRPRPVVHTFTGVRHAFSLSRKLSQQLKVLSQREHCCEFLVLLTGFKVLLYQYAKQDEIVIGISEPSRNQLGIKNVVGSFANLLVLRSSLAGNPTFRTFLAQVSKTVNQARKHQEMPFDRLVQELNPEKDMSRTALFDVLFQFEEQQLLTLDLGDVKARLIDTNIGYGKYDINFSIQSTEGGLYGTAVYNKDIYDRFMIEQMLRHFEVILNAMTSDLNQRINNVALLSEAEEHQQLVTWNSTRASYPNDKTIHQLFEEQARKTPDNTAVSCADEYFTYRELDERANRLAHYLKKQGVTPDVLVALCLDRSLDMIVALLGILKAGGAYLPMNPTYPKERLHFIVQDARISHVITIKTLVNSLPERILSLILLDVDHESISAQPSTSPTHNTSPNNLAYCIYTSGSTGKPKGVLVEHQNVVRLVVNDQMRFIFRENDVWTMFHSYCFDFSVWEMYGALFYGGRLVIVPEQVTKEPSRFLDMLIYEGVTVLNQTPTFFYDLMRETLKHPKLDLALKYVIFGGEALHPIQLKEWKNAYPDVKLINMYGITETTVHVTFREVTDQDIQENETCYLPTPRPYRDYIGCLNSQDKDAAAEFWRQTLHGFSAPTPLVVDKLHYQNQQQNSDYKKLELRLSTQMSRFLQSVAQQHHVTLSTIVQAAWGLLLSRYSGEQDVVFGVTVSGRTASLSGVENIVGLLINTLPLRILISPQEQLISTLVKIQQLMSEVQHYCYTPLVEIQALSEVPGGIPLFESIVVFENYPVDSSLFNEGASLQLSEIESFEQTNYPLTLVAVPGDELLVKISYDTVRFEEDMIRRMLEHLQTIFSAIVENPVAAVGEIPLLSEAERYQLLWEWNNTKSEYPTDKCIHQLFEQQVKRTPLSVAVVFENQQLTYLQLNHRANQLAHHLQSLDVGPEVLVGICLERSVEMVVGLLGILKAGGAYVPLDPTYPAERLSYMLADSGVEVLLTQQSLLECLPSHTARVVCLDRDWGGTLQHTQENLDAGVCADNLAYIIYTSGSTGQPKGVMNTHQAIHNRLLWMQQSYQLTSSDLVMQKTPFSFDVSVWEFFWPLLTGARVVVAKPEGHKDITYLVDLISQQQITTIHFVPSMLQVFLQEPNSRNCSCLKRVFCSGEVLPFELTQRFFSKLKCELHNLYGPTEAAIDVTFWQCQPQENLQMVPIGRPINNTQIYILDSHHQLVPIGVPGELCIGGDGLARGYLNRPELTQEKFIPNPFSDSKSERLYKTGDLARHLNDGNIEFLCRIDHQVKIRGFRIELGEIESALNTHPNIQQAVAIATEDISGNKRLVAYVVTRNELLSTNQLRGFLKEKLPEYMVPSAFILLDALPLTPNGKVDRRALPAPNQSRPAPEETFAPRTCVEQQIADIWICVLKLENVGIHDNFFALGGHSLLATQVISRLRQAFEVELPLRTLFEAPTVAELSDHVETVRWAVLELQASGGDAAGRYEEGEL